MVEDKSHLFIFFYKQKFQNHENKLAKQRASTGRVTNIFGPKAQQGIVCIRVCIDITIHNAPFSVLTHKS